MKLSPSITCTLVLLASVSCGTSTGADETDTSSDADMIERIEGAHGAVCAFQGDTAPVCWGFLPLETVVGDDEPAMDGQLDPPFLPFEHIEIIGVGCGLHEGTVYCWGEDYGQGLLGYGLADAAIAFEEALEIGGVEIGEPVVALDSGASSDVVDARICALTDSGRLFCWGLGTKLGYPGIEAVGDDETPAEAGSVELGGEAVWVDVGGLGSCAALTSGAVRCWGDPALTGGPTIGDNEPPAEGPLLELGAPIQALSVGDAHACAIVGDGKVKCWGNGSSGALGQPGVSSALPDASLQPLELGGPAVEIAARIETSCARLETGEIICWGTGKYGQTGRPWNPACEASSDPFFGFDCEIDPSCCVGDDETPEAAGSVELPAPARDLVSTSNGSCALIESGAVHCWGGGSFGLIGDGLTPDCLDDSGWLCGFDPSCCVGDDETPAAAGRPAVFDPL